MGAGDDDYAKKYMSGGAALGASRMRMGPLLFVLMGSAALSVVVSAVATRQPALLLILLSHAFLTLTMSHLRVTVTRDLVHIQYGLFGPKIPVAHIEDARAVAYDWKRYGGWGIRGGGKAGTAYSVTGGRKMGVELTVRDKNGVQSTVFASSDEPEALVRAIEQARGKVFARGDTGVRIDTGAGGVEPASETVEAEGDSASGSSAADEARRA